MPGTRDGWMRTLGTVPGGSKYPSIGVLATPKPYYHLASWTPGVLVLGREYLIYRTHLGISIFLFPTKKHGLGFGSAV